MTKNDTRIIHTDGLEEGIRCAMCTNPMANNRGCDGGCDINESMYKRVLDVIKKNILEQKPCEDCISRQAVIDCFKKWQPYMATRLHEFENELFELPSVNPQKPKTGHWEQYGNFWEDKFKCSECGKEQPKILCGEQIIGHWSDYCPHCGAKMVES